MLGTFSGNCILGKCGLQRYGNTTKMFHAYLVKGLGYCPKASKIAFAFK